MRSRRAVVSRTPNPQSIRMRVVPASTTRPLPSLPLPIEAKRTASGLLQLVLEQRQDFLARGRAVGHATRILHADNAVLCRLRDDDLELLRLVLLVGLPELQLLEPARVVLLGGDRIGIAEANEIYAARAVAVDDGKAGAVERQAH